MSQMETLITRLSENKRIPILFKCAKNICVIIVHFTHKKGI